MRKGLIRETILDLVSALLVFALFGGFLYAYSGIWPPAVSVTGNSMKPSMEEGDLVIIRSIEKAGVITYRQGITDGYQTFGGYGDVIVFRPGGSQNSVPVIHRAMYWVEQGEQMWPGGPVAPHSGYITLGDNNFLYDQSSSVSRDQPVSPEWIMGISVIKVPYLGLIKARL